MSNTKAVCCVGAAGVLWGLISIFVRGLADAGITPLQVCLIRYTLAAIILACLLAARRPALLRIRLRDAWMFVGTGIISLTLFSWAYFTAITISQASIAVMLLYTSPVFVVVLAGIFFHEPLTRAKCLALVCTFAGSALVAGMFGSAHAVDASVLLYGIGSGFFYALYSIFGRIALTRYAPVTITVYTFVFAVGGIITLADPMLIAGLFWHQPWLLATGAGLAVVSTILPYILYTAGLQHMDAGKAAIVAMCEPLTGALLGLVAYGEPANPAKIVGMALIFLSVALLNKKSPARE